MKKIGIIVAAFAIAFSFSVSQVHAFSVLTESQIASVIGLLTAFNAETQVIDNVEASLRGRNVSGNVNNRTVSCLSLSYNLYLGIRDGETGGEVTKLQNFLTGTGDYTFGRATGYFGPATERAVKKWQASNGVVSSGSPETTGYGVVGPQTRGNMKCGLNSIDQYNPVIIPPTTTNPTCTITASKTEVDPPETITLNWSTNNISNPVLNEISPTGSAYSVGHLNGTMKYTIGDSKWTYNEFQIGEGGVPSSGTAFTAYCSVRVSFVDNSLTTGLTESEIQSITSLIRSFGQTEEFINSVDRVLRGDTSGKVVKHTLTSSQSSSIINLLKSFGADSQTIAIVENIFDVGETVVIPTCSIAANPSSVTLGQSSTITWSTTNANYVADSGGKNSTSGSITVTPNSLPYTYSITAVGSGASTSCSTTISQKALQGTINSGQTYSVENPILSGTGTSGSIFGLSIGASSGDKVYGSGKTISVLSDGTWTHKVSTDLNNGTYTAYLYDPSNNLLDSETFEVSSGSTLATYEGYFYDSTEPSGLRLFIRTQNISKSDALNNCILNANNNPSRDLRCLWGGGVIYDSKKG